MPGYQDCACALLSFGPDKDSIEGRSVVGSAWMSGMRLRVVIVWGRRCARCVALVQYITVTYSFLTLIGRAPPALHLRSYNIVHLCVLIIVLCMRKHRCHGGVKVARFPGMSEVCGSIPVSGLCFLLIFVVFALCLPCYSSLLSSCTVKRGAPSTASCLTHS